MKVAVIGLIFCVFMGITAVSLGFGALYPPLNSVARPLVCPDGEMQYQTSVINPLPDRTYIQADWTCQDASGNVAPINKFLIALYAGSFYGALMFAFFWVLIKLRKGSTAG